MLTGFSNTVSIASIITSMFSTVLQHGARLPIHTLNYWSVQSEHGARFLTGGVYEWDIVHCRPVAVLCMLYNIRCNPMHPLYSALPVPFVPLRVTRAALFAHWYTSAHTRCRTSLYPATVDAMLQSNSCYSRFSATVYHLVQSIAFYSWSRATVDHLPQSIPCYSRSPATIDTLLQSIHCYSRSPATVDTLLQSISCNSRSPATVDPLLQSITCYSRSPATVDPLLQSVTLIQL